MSVITFALLCTACNGIVQGNAVPINRDIAETVTKHVPGTDYRAWNDLLDPTKAKP